ncbi:Single-stranded DNA-binding protein WHY1, chloroplastic [Sesamum angolense]|uniref:Single-stranded DNA-binding protein WHY1, chloroplastic n=1 Tax=Sesamum angolense TaxID=2727404 RepID=A0AAE1X0A0_9LAMI|nr:Single-stranded DNA-binding protein WHY1, chloroplastic [Sesamum angolense]
MVNLSLSATPAGGGLSIRYPHKLSSHNSAIPTSTLFPRRKNAVFLTAPRRDRSKNICFNVKAQYLTPQEQNHQQQRFSAYESPFPSQPGQLPPRVYVGYSIYKGKAALTVEPRPPEFSPLDSGAFKLSRRALFYSSLLLHLVFVNMIGAGNSRSLSVASPELFCSCVIVSFLALDDDSGESCSHLFDWCSEGGRVRKVLKVEPLPDGSGHFFNLSVQNKLTNVDENIYIPITKAEFAVLVSSFNFVIPYLLGWHTFASSIKPEDANRANNANPRSGAEFEWSR